MVWQLPTLKETFVKLNIGPDALSPDEAEPIILANGVQAQTLHINGLTPHCDQIHNYLVTCNPSAGVADLKTICKDILKAVGPNSTNSHAALSFTEVDTEVGNSTWRHLLIRFDINNISHHRLRNVLLHQVDNFLSAGPPL